MLYKKIDPGSTDCVSTAVNHFNIPGTNVGVTKTIFKEFLPLNPVTESPLHFVIPPSQSEIDLSETVLELNVSMELLDPGMPGAAIPVPPVWVNIQAVNDVSTIQMLGASVFRNVKLDIGGREVFNANNLYAFKAYFDTILSYSLEAKRTHLATMGFYEDNLGINNVGGIGYIARRGLFENGAHAQFVSKFFLDLFNQERYFINNTQLDLELHVNRQEFMCFAPNGLPAPFVDMRIRIHSARLLVAFPELTDGLSLGIARSLEVKPAIYAIRRSELKTVYLEPGRTEMNVNIFTEIVPRRVVMGMVANENYTGSFITNPFDFQPYEIEKHHIEYNGIRNPTNDVYMDFANNHHIMAYYMMMRNCGFAFTNMTNGITPEDYRVRGFTIFTWNLTSNAQNDNCFELIKPGTTSYHVRFRAAIPAGGVTMIFYAEHDSILKIDKHRQVTSDLTI